MATKQEDRKRTVVDFMVILVAVGLIGCAIWGMPFAIARPSLEIQSVGLMAGAYALAGALALASQFAAQRWSRRGLARGLLVAAALALLAGLLAFHTIGPRAWITMILPAAILLAATPFIGPMPSPGPSELRTGYQRR